MSFPEPLSQSLIPVEPSLRLHVYLRATPQTWLEMSCTIWYKYCIPFLKYEKLLILKCCQPQSFQIKDFKPAFTE